MTLIVEFALNSVKIGNKKRLKTNWKTVRNSEKYKNKQIDIRKTIDVNKIRVLN